jgi:hypothetical protein
MVGKVNSSIGYVMVSSAVTVGLSYHTGKRSLKDLVGSQYLHIGQGLHCISIDTNKIMFFKSTNFNFKKSKL